MKGGSMDIQKHMFDKSASFSHGFRVRSSRPVEFDSAPIARGERGALEVWVVA
jgi:hypothetical protein